MPLWSFQGARGTCPPNREGRLEGRSLKTQQRVGDTEVDVILGDPIHRTAGKPAIDGLGSPRSEELRIP
jgi:hypothetical protein